jgi:PKD repeat protein
MAVLALTETARATVFTNTRPEIAQMAGLWEVDSVQISSLVTNQYPAFGTTNWEYIVANTGTTTGDHDLHINMAIDSSGTGFHGNNTGSASPIVAEVLNATPAQVAHLQLSSVKHSKTRGIFRFYTEHNSERHFEIHPMTELLTNNAPNSFGLDSNYRPNVTNVSDGATHPDSSLQSVFDGTDQITVTVLSDDYRVLINSPTPSINYVQYAGTALSAVSTDSVSPYFWFRPDLVPSVTVRCRVVTNTLAETAAAVLFSNQTLTVNALTRTDMQVVSNQVAALSYPSNQSASFARPVELVTLSIGNTGVATLPIITDVQTTNVTGTAATIQWTTDVASDSRAIYGLTPSTVTNSVSGTGVTFHTVNLTGLLASTVYYFDVSSASPAGTTTDDNQEQHYIFITAGPFDLPLTPAGGLTSTGNPGGPFTQTNQVYTLSNTNASSASWGVTKIATWLDVSPTNGLLATGNSTNITVSINANANSQAAGSYSDFVIFRNLSSGSLTSRVVRLTVFPLPTLVVTPPSGFDSAGPLGGSFNPASQNYTLSNAGSNTLSWVVGKAANWLDLSATSGILAPGASTTVTVSINTNANSLAENSYSDTLTFTNTTNGIGTTTRAVNLYVSNFGFYDNFSTIFTNGDLVGQQSWTQVGVTSSVPLQVSSGQVVIPGHLTVPNQSAYKNFTQTNSTVFYGMTVTMSFANTNTSAPQYFAGLNISTNAASFNNYRFAAKAGDFGNSNFLFLIRITGEGGDAYTLQANTTLSYGTQYRVIVQALAGGSNANVYVNPTSSDLASQTAYLTNYIGTGTPPPSKGSFVIQQLERNATKDTTQAGASIGKVVVADNFTTVYSDLLGTQPPVAIFTGSPTIGAAPLNVTFTDTSPGSITNRFWDFGDNTTTNTTTNSLVHTYAVGTYPVTLIVSGQDGSSTNTQANYITALTPFEGWQIQYFGSTNNPAAAPSADPDGDGMTDLQEFLAGTNPTNSASAFRITSVASEGIDIRVRWTTVTGKTNALERTAGSAGSFATNDFAAIFTATNTVGPVTNYLDSGAATNVPAFYYRVRLVP